MAESVKAGATLKDVLIDAIIGENFRRLNDSKLPGLMASIEEHGQLQPIAVVETEKSFEVVFGFHRVEALRRLGRRNVLARVYPAGLPMVDRLAMGIVENLQRSDGDRLDLAIQVARLKAELGGSNRETAKRLALSESYLCKLLKVLEVGDELKTLVRGGTLPIRAAYALSQVKDVDARKGMTERAIKEGWTAEDAERAVRERRRPEIRTRKLQLRLNGGLALGLETPETSTPGDLVRSMEAACRNLRKLAEGGHTLADFLTLVELQARQKA